ncbi:MAG: hypothetical protein JWO38_7113 [Gemmataceae bacterium]|nr:hypothetical protein [Gemmataceae bacterium]
MPVDHLVVLSGGLDSAVLAYKLKAEGRSLRAIHVDYRKTVSPRERGAAKLISLLLNIPLEIVESGGMTEMQQGYMPWSRVEAELDVKDDTLTRAIDAQTAAQLNKVVAGTTNWFHITGIHHLISTATYLAQITGISSVAMGITREQASALPKLRAALDAWEQFIALLNPHAGGFSILTPLIGMSKSEIVALGSNLATPLHATWSCCVTSDIHCGECTRCQDRRGAFASAGIVDETRYQGKSP